MWHINDHVILFLHCCQTPVRQDISPVMATSHADRVLAVSISLELVKLNAVNVTETKLQKAKALSTQATARDQVCGIPTF